MIQIGPLSPTLISEKPLAPLGAAWTTPQLAIAKDNAYAYKLLARFAYTRWLYGYAFNFNVPATAQILGVLVELNRKCSSTSTHGGDFRITDALGEGAGAYKDDPDHWITGDNIVYVPYGSSSSLWSLALTPAWINSSAFGYWFQVTNNSSGSRTFSVDHVRMSVFYEPASPLAAYRAQKGFVSGYHCFMKQYMDFSNRGLAPLKLPDGSLW